MKKIITVILCLILLGAGAGKSKASCDCMEPYVQAAEQIYNDCMAESAFPGAAIVCEKRFEHVMCAGYAMCGIYSAFCNNH